MPDEIVAIFVIGSFFGAIAYITRVLSDNRVKRELINMNAGKDVIEQLLLEIPKSDHETSFKWGMVVVSVGLALGIIHFMKLSVDDPLTYALVMIFGGSALLIHYAVKSGHSHKET